MNNSLVDYWQCDKRWGNVMYSSHNDKHQTIASSGSAPTLCADIVATLKDSSVTPLTLAKLALEWGCRTYMSGTTWSFFAKVAERFGFTKFVQSQKWEALTDCIDAGGYVICSVKKGYWSRVGNYILVWKYDNDGIYGIGTERRKGEQGIDAFINDSKMYFCFYP